MKLLSKKDIVLLVIVFFIIGCTNSAKAPLLQNLTNYQGNIDQKIEQVTQKGELYQDSLTDFSKINKDTFELVKEVIYLKNAKFLLETQYDSMEITINQLKSDEIDVEEAKTILEHLKGSLDMLQSKYKID